MVSVVIPVTVLYTNLLKYYLQKSERYRDGDEATLANKVHIQGMDVLLADKASA